MLAAWCCRQEGAAHEDASGSDIVAGIAAGCCAGGHEGKLKLVVPCSCNQGQAVAVDEHAACGGVRRARLCVQVQLLPMLSTAAQRSSAMKGEAPAELGARLMQGHEERGSSGGGGGQLPAGCVAQRVAQVIGVSLQPSAKH